jgi:metal-sulfur cluster biosynthetic enzyme
LVPLTPQGRTKYYTANGRISPGGEKVDQNKEDFESSVSTLPGTGGSDELRSRILDALRNVHDPELGINIVDLGLVYDVSIDEGKVHVQYTLTTMGCPIGPLIEEQMRQLVDSIEGVDGFEAEMVLRPPWTPEMMSEEAKAALGYF